MSVVISGALIDGAGIPMSGCHIILKSRVNTSEVVMRTVADVVTGNCGEYCFKAQTGKYCVYLKQDWRDEYYVGDIAVYDDSKPGTLNDFLTALDEGDLKPDVVKRFEEMVVQAQQSAEIAASCAEQAGQILNNIQEVAGQLSTVRFENFNDISRRCTTAMLKLEQPEVVNTSISLKIKENIDFNYVGAVNGYCDIPEPEKYDVIRVMKDRCYTYDQALAALALMVQRHEAVERYVSGLCALVDENGGVKFFVNRLSAMSSRAYYRLGNAAWVYYALAFYLEKYPDGAQVNIVRAKLLSGISWLDSFLVTAPGDLREGLYKGGLGRYVNGEFDASFVAEWCALEHNVDIWFLFELMGRLEFDGFIQRADALAKSIIRGFWMEEEGRFRQGVHPTSYDNAAALDQSSWGGLFVANIDMAKAVRCRKYMGRFFFGTREATGYTPYHPDYGYSGHSRGVWVEGTAGVALFERKLGNEVTAVNLIAAMAPLRDEYGYRDSCDDPAYDVLPPWPSTTNTAWVILTVKPDNFWLVDSPIMDVGMIRY
ncbi:prophage tail fiber N-terminal domain-containing protein [Escherichia coli]|nr:prophage tail fiber N-terminal domain-containing protein [Escherichia coli]